MKIDFSVNKVTPLSKALAMGLLIVLPFVGFWFGRQNQVQDNMSNQLQSSPVELSEEVVGITQNEKQDKGSAKIYEEQFGFPVQVAPLSKDENPYGLTFIKPSIVNSDFTPIGQYANPKTNCSVDQINTLYEDVRISNEFGEFVQLSEGGGTSLTSGMGGKGLLSQYKVMNSVVESYEIKTFSDGTPMAVCVGDRYGAEAKGYVVTLIEHVSPNNRHVRTYLVPLKVSEMQTNKRRFLYGNLDQAIETGESANYSEWITNLSIPQWEIVNPDGMSGFSNPSEFFVDMRLASSNEIVRKTYSKADLDLIWNK